MRERLLSRRAIALHLAWVPGGLPARGCQVERLAADARVKNGRSPAQAGGVDP